ncbi:MAG: GFA family protein [Altererythrobacter sp.]|nr:GFA family protein [Altererythrobacter sp.]
MKTTYHGSCHCKAITFAADFDIAEGTGKCNCTFCRKQRMWKVRVEPDDFRILTGEGKLGEYARSGEWGEGCHYFCQSCGIATHSYAHVRGMGAPFVTVQVAALDDLPVEDLIAAPLRIVDGLKDNWQHPPQETRHL